MASTEELCGASPADITMVTNQSYLLYDGGVRSFGKCTYNPTIPQTDKGYAVFYSALYYLVTCYYEFGLITYVCVAIHVVTMVYGSQANCNGIPMTNIVAFLHKEYRCPPLTYAFRLLMEDKQLTLHPCWVYTRFVWPQLSVQVHL